MAGTDDGHIGNGNDYVLRVIPGLLMPDVDGIAGIRAEGFGEHGAGVVGEGRVPVESDLALGGTGVKGSGAIGVQGDAIIPNGVGVEGTGATGIRGTGLEWEDLGEPSLGGAGVDGTGSIGVRAYGTEAGVDTDGPIGVRARGGDIGGELAGPIQLRLHPNQVPTEGMRAVEAFEHQARDDLVVTKRVPAIGPRKLGPTAVTAP